MERVSKDEFVVERRLLMNYYPGPLASLSPLAFRRCILLCRGARRYRTNPPSWLSRSGFNDMYRAGGMLAAEHPHYEVATAELYKMDSQIV